jgi:hypothetical protein
MATPVGWMKGATLPVAVRVVTAPVATTIFRMARLFPSATKRFPAPSLARPIGVLKRAAVPVPSVLPEIPGDPARVVTAPVASTTWRMVLLRVSATNSKPAPSVAKP